MYGSTGPEFFPHAAAARRSCLSAACGLFASSPSSVASRALSVPSPQLTGEERPTPRGSKETRS